MAEGSMQALIVEDDRSWQQILSEILTDAGLVVSLADNLTASVDLIHGAAHRLAVVDLSLGGSDHRNQDGLLVLDALKIHDPGCIPILLTGFANVELAVSAISEHGAFTCLRKETFNRRQFREIIQRALASLPPVVQPERSVLGVNPGQNLAGWSGDETSTDFPRSKNQALVVEDSSAWRVTLSELLRESGFQVHACSGYGEALGRLKRDKYRLAVVDLSLAGSLPPVNAIWETGSAQHLEGFRLLASTRAGGIPTIVVSGVAGAADIERAYAEYSVYAFLQKQAFNRQAFLQTINEILLVRKEAEIDGLTDREQEVLNLLANGQTNKEIAEELVISPNTVKRHLKAIFEKLKVHTRSAAAARAVGGRRPLELPEDLATNYQDGSTQDGG